MVRTAVQLLTGHCVDCQVRRRWHGACRPHQGWRGNVHEQVCADAAVHEGEGAWLPCLFEGARDVRWTERNIYLLSGAAPHAPAAAPRVSGKLQRERTSTRGVSQFGDMKGIGYFAQMSLQGIKYALRILSKQVRQLQCYVSHVTSCVIMGATVAMLFTLLSDRAQHFAGQRKPWQHCVGLSRPKVVSARGGRLAVSAPHGVLFAVRHHRPRQLRRQTAARLHGAPQSRRRQQTYVRLRIQRRVAAVLHALRHGPGRLASLRTANRTYALNVVHTPKSSAELCAGRKPHHGPSCRHPQAPDGELGDKGCYSPLSCALPRVSTTPGHRSDPRCTCLIADVRVFADARLCADTKLLHRPGSAAAF